MQPGGAVSAVQRGDLDRAMALDREQRNENDDADVDHVGSETRPNQFQAPADNTEMAGEGGLARASLQSMPGPWVCVASVFRVSPAPGNTSATRSTGASASGTVYSCHSPARATGPLFFYS